MISVSKHSTIRAIVDSLNPKFDDQKAITFYDQNRSHSITFQELKQSIKHLGNALIIAGIEKGDKIAIVSENRIEWVVSYLSIVCIGAVAVPFDILSKENELCSSFKNSDVKMVFTSNLHWRKVFNAVEQNKNITRIISFDENEFTKQIISGDAAEFTKNHKSKKSSQNSNLAPNIAKYSNYKEVLKTGSHNLENGLDKYSVREISSSDEASLIPMEDSTFAVLSHEGLAYNVEGFGAMRLEETDSRDNIIQPLPLHHTYPINGGVLAPLFHYMHVILVSRTNAKSIIQAIKATNGNVVYCVPMLLEGLFEALKNEDSIIDSIHSFIVGGVAVSKQTLLELDNLGYKVIQGYGLTEYCPVVTTNYPRDNKYGSVGKPFPKTKIQIIEKDADGKGQILVKGPSIMKGYYKDEKKTEETINSDGWLKTGDIGRIDADGFLFITGRKKRIIVNKGGKNIYPIDIEKLLEKSEFIAKAYVYPLLDPSHGELPVAVILPNNETLSTFNLNSDIEISDFFNAEVKKIFIDKAIYKRPVTIKIAKTEQDFEKHSWEGIDFEDFYQKEKFSSDSTDERSIAYNIKTAANQIEKYLKEKISRKISVSSIEINPEMSFMDYLDSIEITSIAEDIQYETKIQVNPIHLFEYKTIRSLAFFFASEFKTQLIDYFGKEICDLTSNDNNLQKSEASQNIHDLKNSDHKAELQTIAIIGLDGIFPSSDNPEELWKNLEECNDLISNIKKKRFDDTSRFGYQSEEELPVEFAGILNNIDEFDPLFFGISPKEANVMDPQQRLLLQVVWKTIENAGYKPSDLSGRTGVFVGASSWDYFLLAHKNDAVEDVYTAIGNSHSIIANRISYLLNFNGPSETVDTACSSSLTALHRARTAIQTGDCDVAVVAGVNALFEPKVFSAFYDAGMLSKDGKCKTFDSKANGYVRGEGIGAILLKPLEKAIQDGDYIYALLKGSAVGHTGKSSSLTAPDPNAQAELIFSAYKEANVNPLHISYIEAHGTGTSLGDPIEIIGLKKAFDKLYDLNNSDRVIRNYCALGSVKTNIGHLESAAGIAGVIKVLLSFKNKKIPGLVNFSNLNPYIELTDSPFYISSKTINWEQLRDKDDKQIPRIAGVSSFGFGGTNSHAVFEEYEGNNYSRELTNHKHLIILSAKNKNSLRKAVSELSHFIVLPNINNEDLKNIAYTLIVGREEMDERVAFIVNDIEDLHTKLNLYLDNKIDSKHTFFGNPKQTSLEIGQLFDSNDGEDFLKKIVLQNKISKLAHLWTLGSKIDWDLFLKSIKGSRLPLPTYSFLKEKYWIQIEPKSTNNRINAIGNLVVGQLHPLIQRNSSTLSEQKFASLFQGNEFFLKDHVINQSRLLPGAAYLEMALFCGTQALGTSVKSLTNIAWHKPINFEKNQGEIQIGIYPEENKLLFNIYSNKESGKEMYCDGKIHYNESETTPQNIDIEEIIRRCSNSIDKEKCYESFVSNGYNYGKTFQTIQTLYHNGQEAIALLELTKNSDDFSAFHLHPAILDGAFQTILGIYDADISEDSIIQFVPFAIDEVVIHNKIESKCYSHVTLLEGKNGHIKKFNIKIANEAGNVLVEVNGLYVRELTQDAKLKIKSTSELYFYENKWIQRNIDNKQTEKLPENIILFDTDHTFSNVLNNHVGGSKCTLVTAGDRFEEKGNGDFAIDPKNEDSIVQLLDRLLEGSNSEGVLLFNWMKSNFVSSPEYIETEIITGYSTLLSITKYLIKHKRAHNPVVVLYPSAIEGHPLYEALQGFINTIRLEEPSLEFKALGYSKEENPDLVSFITTELNSFRKTSFVKYISGNRFERQITRVENSVKSDSICFKEDEVYLITGGMGGLGKIFADHISTTAKCSIILCGRSNYDSIDKSFLEKITKKGCSVEYMQADITSIEETKNLYHQIKLKFGKLNGIIHAAGINKDNFILKKEISESMQVIMPKILGVVNLDEVTKTADLSFFVLFSSTAATFGNYGQVDYSYANNFLDTFSFYRNQLIERNERTGKTLSINWPLWKDGGMNIDEKLIQYYSEHLGQEPLSEAAGIRAFQIAFSQQKTQSIILNGNQEKINKYLHGLSADDKSKLVAKVDMPGENINQDEVKKVAINYLKETLSELLKIPYSNINENDHFEAFGIDSIMIMSLTKSLESTFGELSKTLFFEYRNLDELATYFTENHASRISELYKIEASNKVENIPTTPIVKSKDLSYNLPKVVSHERFVNTTSTIKQEEIAIIGVSGRYPKARNLDEFWQNLLDGKDCITEIPKERWDYKQESEKGTDAFGRKRCVWGGFIDDVDKFDPLFFNISPREAELLDPQERIYLETVWHAIEDAGYPKNTLSAKLIGNFVGVMYGHYQLFGPEEKLKGNPLTPSSSHASIANRVSYYFNLNGPSIAVDTMCSSSLTSVHLACQSLLNNECEMAIAGGVNVSIHPFKYDYLGQGGFLAEDGKCRSFGEGGSGYVPGEGTGCVILKPLSKAIKDGDNIYAVVKSSAINHGGKANGYTVPNPNAQASLITAALKKAKINPKEISYIETHGTGTSLGDPIEIAALSRVFKEFTSDKQFCPIGSVKSNIGHLESAAGIAGITKVLLQFKNKTLVPSIHSKILNPNINFKETPFYVQQEIEEWNKQTVEDKLVPRLACVSAFGAGGANAHIILQEYNVENTYQEETNTSKIFTFSAKNKERLKEYAENFAGFVEKIVTPHEKEKAKAAFTEENVLDEIIRVISDISKIKREFINPKTLLWEFGFDDFNINKLFSSISLLFNVELDLHVVQLHKTIEHFAQLVFKLNSKETAHSSYRPEPQKVSLAEVAYTLQCGREMMDERLAIAASSFEELYSNLKLFLKGTENTENIASGNINTKASFLNLDSSITDDIYKALIQKKQFHQLMKFWIVGGKVNWSLLYPNNSPKKVTLPDYPFSKERYWIKTKPTASVISNNVFTQKLHPFIDSNASNLFEFAFVKSFNWNEDYIANHLLRSNKTFQPLFLLEMARKAGELVNPNAKAISFEKINWSKPLFYNDLESLDFKINFYPAKTDILYEIFNENKKLIISQGQLKYKETAALGKIDLSNIIKSNDASIKMDEWYDSLKRQKINISDYYRNIDKMYLKGNEALATLRLSLPQQEKDSIVFHPKVLDAIEQTISYMTSGSNESTHHVTSYPFSIDKISVSKHSGMASFIYIKEFNSDKSKLASFEVYVLNEVNEILFMINGLRIISSSKREVKQNMLTTAF